MVLGYVSIAGPKCYTPYKIEGYGSTIETAIYSLAILIKGVLDTLLTVGDTPVESTDSY